jgi:hypothetical protein
MVHATLLDTTSDEPLPLAPPPFFDPDILGIRIVEDASPAEWGPIERISLRDHVDRIALSVVCALGTVAALLGVALFI